MTLNAFLDYWCALHWQRQLQHLAQYLLVALLLVIVEPFGTLSGQPLTRLAYWFSILTIFGLGMMPVVTRIIRSTGAFDDFSRWSGIFGCVLFATIPMTFIVHAIEYLAWLIATQREGGSANAALPSRDTAMLMVLFVQVLVINLLAIGVNSLFILVSRGLQPDPRPKHSPGIRFLSRLPDHLGTRLLHLQMEDHYLRATTISGDTLILMRFRDALDELADYDGIQVHRSWWVARDAVEKFSRNGRKLELLVKDGTRVPVSAAYRKAAEVTLLGSR